MNGYDKCLDKMPLELVGAYDPHATTLGHLISVAQHALDMDEDGEWPLSASERKNIKAFRARCLMFQAGERVCKEFNARTAG